MNPDRTPPVDVSSLGRGAPPRTDATPTHKVLRRVLRPELTAIAGCVVAYAFFAVAAGRNGFLTAAAAGNYLEVAAEVGVIAAPATLLLIAGEFDLSVGSMIALAQIAVSYAVINLHWPLLFAVALGLLLGVVVGVINGLLVVKTGMPSFIVTLAGLYWISGLAQGAALVLTGGTIISGVTQALKGDPLLHMFSGMPIAGIPVSVYWWIAATAVAAWVLHSTPVGNWITAVGGAKDAARQLGVPTHKIKVALYIATATAAVIVAVLQMFVVNQGDASAGTDMEFEVILSAVIGGSLLTGGFGSPIGTAFGALLYGLVVQGFFFTNIPDQWYTVFLGLMLLLAVFVNRAFHRTILRTGDRW